MDCGNYDICIVGGAGHVGLPLALAFSAASQRVIIYDVDTVAMDLIKSGTMPFVEYEAAPLLTKALRENRLLFSSEPRDIGRARYVIVAIGTPVDEFQNPEWEAVTRCVADLLPHLHNAELLVLRSTVSPGTTDRLQQFLVSQEFDLPVAFCPERVVQGQAIDEMQQMPQIISGTSPLAERRAAAIFGRVATSVVLMKPMEAEFAKLFCNAYRYVQFAASNQFFMMAHRAGCDYRRIVAGIKEDYPRMAGFPGAGFTAGPCLLKDTLQLAAGSNHQFALGHAAIQVNEGLPAFVVEDIQRRFPLSEMTVGILGMAFKAGSDDVRSSLSYKLKKLLRLHAKAVLTTDPFVASDPELRPIEQVIAESDLLVIAAPHPAYASLETGGTPVVDVWNLLPVSTPALETT